MPQRVTLYLLLETSRHFTREIFRGIIRWSNLYGPTRLIVSTGHIEQELPKLQKIENVGIIARLTTPGVIDAVRKLHVPVVTIEPSIKEYVKIKQNLQISEIVSNSPAIAHMAAEHFLARGFRHFAFCGLPCRIWSQIREEAFYREITQRQLECSIYPQPHRKLEISREKERPYIVRWLKTLPKPVAIFTCNDDRGAQVLEACQMADFSVPDTIAVLGVDNDDLICELTSPALSSIAFDLQQAGFTAAGLLWGLISGTVTGYHSIPVEPTHVVTRLSTDVEAQDDEIVSRAIRYIRGMFQRPIGVANVSRDLGISRRTLERHFSAVLGRSVREEIEQFRFEQAKHLLLESSDNMEEIAIMSGFQNLKPMIRAFIQREGISPGAYRKRHKM